MWKVDIQNYWMSSIDIKIMTEIKLNLRYSNVIILIKIMVLIIVILMALIKIKSKLY